MSLLYPIQEKLKQFNTKMNVKGKLQQLRGTIRDEGGIKEFYFKRRDVFLSYMWIGVRCLCLLAFGCILLAFFENKKVEYGSSVRILETIISCLGIFIAIIITYFFSKLYSERSERIMRKQRIDKFSIKITAVRRIATFLKSQHEFWDNFKHLRYKIDTQNRYMTLPSFLDLNFDDLMKFTKDIGEQPIQTYLSIKYLEHPSPSIFNPFSLHNHRNYTLDELYTMKYACSVIWSFFDRNYTNEDLNIIKSFYKEPIIENLKILYPEKDSFDNRLLVNVFSDIQPVLEESHYLTYINNISIFGIYGRILYNVLIFISIILSSVFC